MTKIEIYKYKYNSGGGGNPGTPTYVGMLGIILRRQKNTSGYIIGITPLLVKLA